MKQLLNTLYVLSEDSYLSLDGENIVVERGDGEKSRFPLHMLEGVVSFSYKGASPRLMGACVERNVALSFFTPSGRFLSRVTGLERGNVLLRNVQVRLSDDPAASARIARGFLMGKTYNARWLLERFTRDHPMQVDVPRVKRVCERLAQAVRSISACEVPDTLRGLEGDASGAYFSVFDEMLLNRKDEFFFKERSRRPPLDNVNCMLSFSYALLANMCAAALSGANLDPYVGYLHRDRSGRASLALDLMEEMRPAFADRFVVSCVNNRVMQPKHFLQRENSATTLTDEGRRVFLAAWQERKKETITHPYLNEKMPWGLVPHVQALLFARFLRGDLSEYPPFFWK